MKRVGLLFSVGFAICLCLPGPPAGGQAGIQKHGFSTEVYVEPGKKLGTHQFKVQVTQMGTGKLIAKSTLIVTPSKPADAEVIDPDTDTVVKWNAQLDKPRQAAIYRLSITQSGKLVSEHAGSVILE